jgi:hypothetical protein
VQGWLYSFIKLKTFIICTFLKGNFDHFICTSQLPSPLSFAAQRPSSIFNPVCLLSILSRSLAQLSRHSFSLCIFILDLFSPSLRSHLSSFMHHLPSRQFFFFFFLCFVAALTAAAAFAIFLCTTTSFSHFDSCFFQALF